MNFDIFLRVATHTDDKKSLGYYREPARPDYNRRPFYRTGAIAVWGRGTNRVIEACSVRR